MNYEIHYLCLFQSYFWKELTTRLYLEERACRESHEFHEYG